MVGTVLQHRSESAANAAAIRLASGDEGGLVSEAAETAPGELVEPGRALALADFAPPSVGAGERLIRLAYRFGISGSALSAPFRKPAKPRLLATVANPLPGNRTSGTALRAGHFLVHGVKSPIAQIDFAGAARLAFGEQQPGGDDPAPTGDFGQQVFRTPDVFIEPARGIP